MLESRMEYLDSVVDYFVIVESNVTFSGKQKPLYFAENQLRFKKYSHKIVYFPFIFDNSIHQFNFDVEVDLEQCIYHDTVHWQIEKMQRNHIANAVKIFDGNPFVILSDVDEIPSIEAINFAKQHAANEQIPIASFFVKLFFYNLHNLDPSEWMSIIFTNKKVLLEKTPQFLRSNHRNESMVAPISNGGWHLSFFLTPEQIQYKIKSYSHQEHNREEITNIHHINQSLQEGASLFFKGVRYNYVDNDQLKQILPTNFLQAFSKFL